MSVVNYTGRDFTARFEALLSEFRRLCPELTDMNHSNAGIALIRLLGSESDFISFYIDHIFSENFVDHAQFRQNLIRIGKNVDVLPKLCSASRTFVKISRLEGVKGDLFIPQYTRFARTDGLGYLTDKQVTIPSGVESVLAGVTQGELVELEIGSELFKARDHGRRLRYNLGPDVAAYTCVVKGKDNGETWIETESFYRTLDEDSHYLLELQADPVDEVTDTVYLTLNKRHGATDLPERFQISFIRASKWEGNTGADTITICPSNLAQLVSVTNMTSATGGGGVESAAQLRLRIPAATRIQRRAVTNSDYVALIRGISGVRGCESYDRTDDSQWPHMRVVIYVTPEGGGKMSEALKERIWLTCGAKGHLGSWPKRYILKDMTEIAVNISARVGLVEYYEPDAVFTQIRQALHSRYNLYGSEPVKIMRFSDLHSIVSGVAGVSWVEFDTPTGNEVAGAGSILALGSISLQRGE